jgi:hypothetical protein
MRLAPRLPDGRRFRGRSTTTAAARSMLVGERRRKSTAGGAGANFVGESSGPLGMGELLVEAVIVGRSASAGISFTSVGRVITNEPQ